MDKNITLSDDLQNKYQQLRKILNGFDRILVAFSGGVDSTLLLKVALDCLGRDRVLACLGTGQIVSETELEQARKTACQLGANLEIVERQDLANRAFLKNTKERCYLCKSAFFQQLLEIAKIGNYDAVFSGSNADDLNDYRPGSRAEKEYSVVKPLEQAGLTKADIRQLSKELSLVTWNKPSDPCLVTRIQYGVEITPERLKQIEQAETFLRELGFTQFRVRHHGYLARIEVPTEQIKLITDDKTRQQIVDQFRRIGFIYVSLDLQGFRSGSGNEILS